ncbi:hypothetical protein [Herminiimonas sp. CN]|uniref:hypothetical protein n=1 Tax=Herminiimonas sp. CN TaxID=1349818 RepID=UPI0012DDE037|nr:hypothetical protein [Herminiimonas sp. CN]
MFKHKKPAISQENEKGRINNTAQIGCAEMPECCCNSQGGSRCAGTPAWPDCAGLNLGYHAGLAGLRRIKSWLLWIAHPTLDNAAA